MKRNPLVLTAVLTLAFSAQAFAGPGCGGVKQLHSNKGAKDCSVTRFDPSGDTCRQDLNYCAQQRTSEAKAAAIKDMTSDCNKVGGTLENVNCSDYNHMPADVKHNSKTCWGHEGPNGVNCTANCKVHCDDLVKDNDLTK